MIISSVEENTWAVSVTLWVGLQTLCTGLEFLCPLVNPCLLFVWPTVGSTHTYSLSAHTAAVNIPSLWNKEDFVKHVHGHKRQPLLTRPKTRSLSVWFTSSQVGLCMSLIPILAQRFGCIWLYPRFITLTHVTCSVFCLVLSRESRSLSFYFSCRVLRQSSWNISPIFLWTNCPNTI